ncbi:MAG TPA: hypothetical protein VNP92_31600 [Actinophytocola sp.]|nr:hypothetical protein [Actinophytocola sp.]
MRDARTRPWPSGKVVLLRHVRDARTWCALPVTVLDDDERRSVIRISAGTDWLAAVHPSGRRAHGFDRHWRLARVTWRRHDLTYVVPHGRWFATGLVTEKDTSRLHKLYINAQDPLRRKVWGFDTMDRELDLEIDPVSWRPRWKDVDRFRRLRAAGALSLATSRRIWRETAGARSLAPHLRAVGEPWLRTRCAPPDLRSALRAHVLPADLRRHR